MTRVLVAAIVLAFCAGLGVAAPKVAVLDAVLSVGMASDISTGVTEKVSEQLVSSGGFMVLDRTTVAQSLKEIEFQISGLVLDRSRTPRPRMVLLSSRGNDPRGSPKVLHTGDDIFHLDGRKRKVLSGETGRLCRKK